MAGAEQHAVESRTPPSAPQLRRPGTTTAPRRRRARTGRVNSSGSTRRRARPPPPARRKRASKTPSPATLPDLACASSPCAQRGTDQRRAHGERIRAAPAQGNSTAAGPRCAATAAAPNAGRRAAARDEAHLERHSAHHQIAAPMTTCANTDLSTPSGTCSMSSARPNSSAGHPLADQVRDRRAGQLQARHSEPPYTSSGHNTADTAKPTTTYRSGRMVSCTPRIEPLPATDISIAGGDHRDPQPRQRLRRCRPLRRSPTRSAPRPPATTDEQRTESQRQPGGLHTFAHRPCLIARPESGADRAVSCRTTETPGPTRPC